MSSARQTQGDCLFPRDVGADVDPDPTSARQSWLIGLAVVALLFVLSWPVGLVVAVVWGLLYAFLAATK